MRILICALTVRASGSSMALTGMPSSRGRRIESQPGFTRDVCGAGNDG